MARNCAHDVVAKSITRDRKRLRKRLTEREFAALRRAFNATGSMDLYGTLEEYLMVIAQHLEKYKQTLEQSKQEQKEIDAKVNELGNLLNIL